MSSFVGIVRWGNERRLKRRDGERLTTAVAQSGSRRAWLISEPPFHAAFNQTVVTPEDVEERQPAAASNVVSLFAGRIDDREGAASRLNIAHHGSPNSALALAAFRKWGAEAPGQIVGEFAWAAWDKAAHRLMLARDISSAHTLYVYRSEDLVAFATGLPALFALAEVPRKLDEQGLAESLVLCPGRRWRTLYLGVDAVPIGATLTIERGRPTQTSDWQPAMVAVPCDPQDCAEAAREVFGRAMRPRLRAIGPVAVALSGGLDSSIVAAEAAHQQAPDPVKAFVVRPRPDVPLGLRRWEAPDDRDQVDALARLYPNLHISIVEPGIDPLDADPTALFAQAGHPTGLAPNLTWMLAGWRAARASGARLLLAGDHGEASLTHYGSLRTVVQQGDVVHALREAWLLGRRKQGSFLGQLDRAFLGGRLTAWRHRDGAPQPGEWPSFSLLNPDLAARTGMRERLSAAGFPNGFRYRPRGQRAVVETCLNGGVQAGESVAALRRLSGLEYTGPFLDRRVVEFCLSLPEAMYVRNGWTRWLARTAFRNLLPSEVRWRNVKAAQNPEWFHRLSVHRKAYQAQLERIAASSLANRILDIPRMKALLDDWPESMEAAMAREGEYRLALARGLQAGAFLRWIDGGNN